jgi:hypothetical protein
VVSAVLRPGHAQLNDMDHWNPLNFEYTSRFSYSVEIFGGNSSEKTALPDLRPLKTTLNQPFSKLFKKLLRPSVSWWVHDIFWNFFGFFKTWSEAEQATRLLNYIIMKEIINIQDN